MWSCPTLLNTTGNTPDSVSDVRVVPITSRSLEVSWRPPFDTHGPLTQYIIRGTDQMMGSTFEHMVEASETSTILSDLDIYTLYELAIIPYNDNGPGGATSITARTPGAMPSAPPSNVSVHPAPSVPNALDISWVPPPLNKRNGEITQYKLRYRERGGEIINVQIEGTQTSYRLAGLERETDYEIKIAMVNVNGTGPFTDWHPGRTEAIVPNATAPGQAIELQSPMEVFADPQSSTEILLTWSDPNPINPKPGVVRYYTVVYNSRTNEYEIERGDTTHSHKFIFSSFFIKILLVS
ncbi:neogenin-like [Diadema antillarum]|uniref:neogenin-like n=1 Tax=Diadema antillarum TaxID=105358 RepID=UPI003A88725C